MQSYIYYLEIIPVWILAGDDCAECCNVAGVFTSVTVYVGHAFDNSDRIFVTACKVSAEVGYVTGVYSAVAVDVALIVCRCCALNGYGAGSSL